MVGMSIFAHASHDHAVAATAPWWSDQLIVSVIIVALFAAGLLTAHLLKIRPPVVLIGTLFYLLAVGLICFRVAPVASTAALAVGIMIALVSTLAQLGHKNNPHSKK